MKKVDLDIVLPCYNPAPGWERIVVSTYKELQALWSHLTFHVYVINDGSTSGFEEETVAYLEENIPDIQMLAYVENKGKGYALRKGVAVCRSEYILYTDHDFPYTLESMSHVISLLLQGVDVVTSTRGAGYYVCLPFLRRCISRFFRWCNRYVFRMSYPDTQAGLKGFNKRGRVLFLSTRIHGFLFDWEFIRRVSKETVLQIQDVDVELRKNVCFSGAGIVFHVV